MLVLNPAGFIFSPRVNDYTMKDNDFSHIESDLTPLEASQLKEDEADAQIAANNLDNALQCLTKAILLRPEHAQLYDKRAQVYVELCDVKSAIASYRKIFAIDSNPPQRIKDKLAALLDLHAYSLLCLGEPPHMVLDYFNEAIQLNAFDEVYWLHRAMAKIKASNFEAAVADIDRCICLNSRDVEYFTLRAQLHWQLGMGEKATADLRKAAYLQPDHPEVLGHEQRLLKEYQAIYDQACTHLMTHQWQDAIETLSKATEIRPEDTKLYLLRASAYRELGEYHTALRDTEKALNGYYHRMDIKSCERNSQENQHDISKHVSALRSNPDQDVYCDIIKQRSLILNDIGINFLRQKSYQLAVNAMNQAIRGQLEIAEHNHEQFSSPQLYLYRGDAYCGLGNLQAALADYHHVLEMHPSDQNIKSRVALIHYRFGVELFNRAQFDKAGIEFGRAIEQNSNISSYHVRKGDAARYLGNHQSACESYENALRLNPKDTETLVSRHSLFIRRAFQSNDHFEDKNAAVW